MTDDPDPAARYAALATGNFAAPSARVATAGHLIDEALRLAREIRLYPSDATLADMAACVPEGTPTRAVLDAWLHARKQGDEHPVIYVGANALGMMRPTTRQALAGLVDLRQSAALDPDTVAWFDPRPASVPHVRYVTGERETP